ncbi:hypothetical protein QQF64_012440 [Cirrhinus molitorella]|uniref:C2H2-type domain-containing protein n=1 Tax=Cirrhinus molitorella TaxID=172907 RepID=A0ABR3LVH8_9TELE
MEYSGICAGFAIAVPNAAAHPSRPRLMASWREERDYGALPSEQRSEPRVTVADSPTQPTGFNHVCSPSMFSLFLFRFISLSLGFSVPSSILLSLSHSLCTGAELSQNPARIQNSPGYREGVKERHRHIEETGSSYCCQCWCVGDKWLPESVEEAESTECASGWDSSVQTDAAVSERDSDRKESRATGEDGEQSVTSHDERVGDDDLDDDSIFTCDNCQQDFECLADLTEHRTNHCPAGRPCCGEQWMVPMAPRRAWPISAHQQKAHKATLSIYGYYYDRMPVRAGIFSSTAVPRHATK